MTAAFALITINEIVLSRAIAIAEARLKYMEERLAHISEKQTETEKRWENIITVGAGRQLALITTLLSCAAGLSFGWLIAA